MNEDFQTFLTRQQFVDAVALDFDQYGRQPELFRRIASLVLGDDFKRGGAEEGKAALIRRGKHLGFEAVDSDVLGFYLIHALETLDLDAASMARAAVLVFETDTCPGVVDGESGVWIDSQMNGLTCRRCGNCCRNLDNACAQEDVMLWERLGRKDILAWVREEPLPAGDRQYRIWVDPATGRTVQPCPFLGETPGERRCFCMIQEVKPLACREYPFTRKHARMTGCPGFGPENMSVIAADDPEMG